MATSKRKDPLKERRAAAAEARKGHTDAALATLRAMADGGDEAAASCVAAILAFRGEWEEAAARATSLLADPDSVYSANIFNDCAAIVRRAAVEVARAFMRKKQPAKAWAAIESRTWWPVEKVQVAPIELVTDFLLVPLMSKPRCQAILARPRGNESR
jgi:hypothetical protein